MTKVNLNFKLTATELEIFIFQMIYMCDAQNYVKTWSTYNKKDNCTTIYIRSERTDEIVCFKGKGKYEIV